MKGTLKIATFFKIPVYLHWSFPLILLSVLYLGFQVGAGAQGMATIGLFFALIFTCVVMHEYGHALTARRYGVQTRDIILSPIGGVARLERIPTRPVEELKVALAGPAVNIVIAILLLPVVYLLRNQIDIHLEEQTEIGALHNLYNLFPLILITNIMLAIFNMIPAFPMDGGRVLRSLLAMKLGRVKATKIAYIVAQFSALGLIIYGLYFGNYVLFFIAIFVVFTSRLEWQNVKRASIIEKMSIKDLMDPLKTRLYRDQTIQDALSAISNEERYFLVFNRNEKVVGVLFHEFIMHAQKENDLDSPIEKYRSNTWEAISSHYPLDNTIALFQQRGYGIVPVIEEDKLIGQLDIIKLNRFVNTI